MESKAVCRVKALVNAKVKPDILTKCSHYLIPGHNKSKFKDVDLTTEEFSKEYTSGMFQEFPYKSDLPKPLLPPRKIQRDCSVREDPSLELIHTKMKIQEDVNRYLELYKKHADSLNQPLQEDIEWSEEDGVKRSSLPKYLAASAEILECDPDPYFSGTYNWYYSGGTITSISYDSKNILIFPYSKELVALPVTLKDDSLLIPNFDRANKMPLKDDVLQVVCSVSNNSGRILTRHKSSCYIYDLFYLNKSKLKLLEVWRSRESAFPYISVDLDPMNISTFCTLNVERTIILRDMNKSERFDSANVPFNKSTVNNWASIKFDKGNSKILKFADTNCVQHFDIRSSIKQPVLTIHPGANLEDCEHLSAFVSSCKSEYYSYVGSNHSICLLDIRYPDSKVVTKWTHQLKSTPLFAEVCLRDDEEFVVMASQFAGEVAIILNTWDSGNDTLKSLSTPYTPSTSIETLAAAQLQGKCLNPHLRDRLLLCNTGCITMLDQSSGEVFLSTQNSLNDIFYQGIGHQEPLDAYSLENCKALYKLKKWEREITKNHSLCISAPLVVTKRANARNLFRTFTTKKLDCDTNDQSNLYDYVPTWKRNVAELESFVDIFAPELLAPWEVSEEVAPLVPVTPTRHLKVLSWLGMSEEVAPETSQKEPCAPKKSVIEECQELPAFQDTVMHKEQDSESIQQLFLPKVSSQKNKKIKKNAKKPSFVPGF